MEMQEELKPVIEALSNHVISKFFDRVPENKITLAKYLCAELSGVAYKNLIKGKQYVYKVDGKTYTLYDGTRHKALVGENYNYYFNKTDGTFIRWGKTLEDDPDFSPVGPEIYDCECTTICQGVPDKNNVRTPCKFCYKSNTCNGKNLTFDDFKKIIDLFPRTLTQVAFGADSQCISNPDLWKMMQYCREIGIVPNITVADVSDEVASKLNEYCGAVAVSRYANKDICYNSVKKLATDRRMKQVNIHAMLSLQTFDDCMETANDILTDPRLKNVNAVVFLGLKKKGRAESNFDVLPFDKFKELISFCLKNDVRFGFDSCSAPRFEKVVNEMEISDDTKRQLIQCSESCESGCFSFYTNVDGCYFPCSFTEGCKGWENGLPMINANDFIKEIWNQKRNCVWRNALIKSKRNGCRQCLSFHEINV